jgi:hypothetical protein
MRKRIHVRELVNLLLVRLLDFLLATGADRNLAKHGMTNRIIVAQVPGILANRAFHNIPITENDGAGCSFRGWSNREVSNHVADSFHGEPSFLLGQGLELVTV